MANMKFSGPDCVHICGFLLLPMLLQGESMVGLSTICTTSRSPSPWWQGPAPSPPTLPQQYSLRVEANIIQNGWTTEVEENYDSVNHRASVSLTRNGSTTVSIFNFDTNQRFDIYPNGTCLARPTEVDMFGFVSMNKQDRPTMATVNEVFRFGRKFNWTYVAKETVRGIPVNHWTSCQSWIELGARFQLDYYFSDPDYTTASGVAEIPVRAELRGRARNVDMANDPVNGMHTFQHVYEFTSFWAGPVVNRDVFRIPRGIFCSGRTDSKPLPQLPQQLEMSIEVVGPDSDIYPLSVHLRCDHNSNIQEMVTTNIVSGNASSSQEEGNGGNPGFGNLVTELKSVIKDYNSDLVYITNAISKTCTVRKMSPPKAGLQHNYCLLPVTNNSNQFVYQGQTTFRGMLVEAWSMVQDSIITEVYFLPELGANSFQIMTGIFIKNKTSANPTDLPKLLQDVFGSDRSPEGEYTSDRLQELLPSSSHSPTATGDQLDWGLQLELLMDQTPSSKTINIFNYRSLLPDASSLQINQCFPETEISEVTLFIIADYDTEVASNLFSFSSSLRNVLAQKVGVSILHISNMAMTPGQIEGTQQHATEVHFTLLGSANLPDKKQKSLAEIRDALIKAVSRGITIHERYSTDSKNFMVHKEVYFIDNRGSEICSNRNGSNMQTLKNSTNVSSHKTYTPATVAGIAVGSFSLGALACLVITMFVHRRGSVNKSLISQDTLNF